MRHRSSSAPISGMLTNHPHSDILTRSGHLNRPILPQHYADFTLALV